MMLKNEPCNIVINLENTHKDYLLLIAELLEEIQKDLRVIVKRELNDA